MQVMRYLFYYLAMAHLTEIDDLYIYVPDFSIILIYLYSYFNVADE